MVLLSLNAHCRLLKHNNLWIFLKLITLVMKHDCEGQQKVGIRPQTAGSNAADAHKAKPISFFYATAFAENAIYSPPKG